MSGITLLGLGPGEPAQITRQAWDILCSVDEIWLRTIQHPTTSALPPTIKKYSFDDFYEKGRSFESVYEAIVDRVLELGQRQQGVIYAVPGDPFVAEATCPEIERRARAQNIFVRVINGMSFLEPTFSALGLDPYPRLVLMDALELSEAHIPNYPPDMPVLIAQIYSRLVAAEIKMTLNTIYPDKHPIRLVHAAGTKNERVENIPLYRVDRSKHIGLMTTLYIPPLDHGTSFETIQEIVAHLRAPDGCPWDREQTHQSLRPHLLEESYETLAALDSEDPQKMTEEFGDLLLQIVLNAQIASDNGEFTIADVCKGIYEKIIRRHPHVFGDMQVESVKSVLLNWENLKAAERDLKDETDNGILKGVPLALPALSQAQEYQERAARVGFDWPNIEGVLDKIGEEIQEVKQSRSNKEFVDEMGDLFFALVNLTRWKKVDAESTLRETNKRFKQRFRHVEQGAKKLGKKLSEMSIEEMESLWQDSKRYN